MVRAEVLENHQRLEMAVVGDGYARPGSLFADEIFISTQLPIPQQDGGFRLVKPKNAVPLDEDATVSCAIFDCDGRAGSHTQLFGGEIWVAISDPFFRETLIRRAGSGQAGGSSVRGNGDRCSSPSPSY